MPIVHCETGKFYQLTAKDLTKPAKKKSAKAKGKSLVVCLGDGRQFEVSAALLKKNEVRPEKAPASLRAHAKKKVRSDVEGQSSDRLGEPVMTHCAACSVRG